MADKNALLLPGAQTMIEAQHAARLFRPTVVIAALIGNELITARSAKAPNGTGWKLPQGGIDEGESIERAAIRELGEETPIEVDESQVVFDATTFWVAKEYGPGKKTRDGYTHGKFYVPVLAEINVDPELAKKMLNTHRRNNEVASLDLCPPNTLIEKIMAEPDKKNRNKQRRAELVARVLGHYGLVMAEDTFTPAELS